jgi:hypothetical protein
MSQKKVDLHYSQSLYNELDFSQVLKKLQDELRED